MACLLLFSSYMGLKPSYLLFTLFFVTISVAPLSLWAAPGSCRFVHKAQKLQATADMAPFDKLNEAYAILSEVLSKKSGRALQQRDLQALINRVESATEDFLGANHIKYQKESVAVTEVSWKKIKISEMTYSVYRITGVDKLDYRMGQFLNGVLQHKDLKGVTLIYDPFYEFSQPESGGHYELDSKRIVFSYISFMNRYLGTGDTLRHEVHHALEDAKLHQGRKTLAQFRARHGVRSDEAYSDGFRMDELETHLRDLRYLVHIASRTDQLRISVSYSQRERSKKFKAQILRRLLDHSKMILAEIELKILRHEKLAQATSENGVSELQFSGFNGSAYSIVSFKFSNAVGGAEPVLKETLQWAQNRIYQIEAELKFLMPSSEKSQRRFLN